MTLCDRCRTSRCYLNRAGYIRSMSDEEMARELIDIIYDLCENGVLSYDFILEWLRRPMEE